MTPAIKILIVDDSMAARAALRSMLETQPDITVVGEAVNGRDALELIPRLKPSLVTMDLEMPVMGGMEAIQRIMCSKAVPILVVSSVANATNACEALRLGALDVISKPRLNSEDVPLFIEKVRLLADIVVITRRREQPSDAGLAPEAGPGPPIVGPQLSVNHPLTARRTFAIAVSTGGPQALARILPSLPAEFPGNILIAQHITDGFAAGLAQWLNSLCPLNVTLAIDQEPIEPGKVYISPSEKHLTCADGRIRLCERQPGDLYHPSCDALLSSVAEACGPRAVGIIMTGMGSDGVTGLTSIRAAGGITLAQNEATSVIYGMNQMAVEAGVVDRLLPLEEIPAVMVHLASMGSSQAWN